MGAVPAMRAIGFGPETMNRIALGTETMDRMMAPLYGTRKMSSIVIDPSEAAMGAIPIARPVIGVGDSAIHWCMSPIMFPRRMLSAPDRAVMHI